MTIINHVTSRFWLAAVLLLLAPVTYAEEKPFTVAILMFDEVQIIDFAAPYEVFGQADYDVFTVSESGESITTALGLSVTPRYSFKTMPQADAILVPGGDTHEVMADKEVQHWLQAMQNQNKYILSVCTGSHILAESGLLDNKSATTFHGAMDAFEKNYPAITVLREKRFVDNGKVITSAGLSSGIDASLHLVSEVSGEEKARSVALHIEYDWDPDGGFVRAVMADQYFPDNQYDWPEGIRFERLYSFGDTADWKTAYTAKTPVSAAELQQRYKDAMAVHDDWEAVTKSSPGMMRWRGINAMREWTHQVSVVPEEAPDTYTILLEMHHTPVE